MLSERLTRKILCVSFLVFLLSFAFLQWLKNSQNGNDVEIRIVVFVVMLSIIFTYCCFMVLLLSYFANLVLPTYLKNMDEVNRGRFLSLCRIVLTKEKYYLLKELLVDIK